MVVREKSGGEWQRRGDRTDSGYSGLQEGRRQVTRLSFRSIIVRRTLKDSDVCPLMMNVFHLQLIQRKTNVFRSVVSDGEDSLT